ncbi:hypothetical protein C1638_020935 [Chryseobacterium oncorhynchi]|uniref:Uncharacterized protein n=1 Tax=Chryseobacterium oncorhynchi TaxID=741074 RepID=A0A316WEY9_9FLAO|nr:hypothetical protein C1638_020935 [Chryseobacterium oncorhynchi]
MCKLLQKYFWKDLRLQIKWISEFNQDKEKHRESPKVLIFFFSNIVQPSGFRIRENDQRGQLGIFMRSPALFRKDPPGVERSAPADKMDIGV